MEVSNQARVAKALDLLKQGLGLYVEQEMQAVYGEGWRTRVISYLPNYQKEDDLLKDVAPLLAIVKKEWEKVFKKSLGQPTTSLVHELIEVRNQWAHQFIFSTEDTYRAVDSVLRLLKAFHSSPQVAEVEGQRREIVYLLAQSEKQEVRSIPVSPAEEARIRQRLDSLLKRIPFQNACLLKQALTHTSYKFENPNTGEDNEQLEFIGDALLTFLSGDFLYHRNPELKEGNLTVLRSNLVDAAQLARFATELKLGQWMQLGRGVDKDGGRSRVTLLSNVFEAVIGAYYLDSGIEAVRDLMNPFFEEVVNDLPTTENATPQSKDDAKSWLQQVVLGRAFSGNPNRKPPEYKTIRTDGTDNQPEFTSVVFVAGSEYGSGKDSSKQKAEKRAAEDALRKLGLLHSHRDTM